jgi:hypothetical protein
VRARQPGAGDITSIAPAPTVAERRKIVQGIFGPVPLAPLELPAEVSLVPCVLPCQCANVRWSAWTPNQIPQTVMKDVELLQPDQTSKSFTQTFSIKARVRHGFGNCE